MKIDKKEIKEFIIVLILCFLVAIASFYYGGSSVCQNMDSYLVPLGYNNDNGYNWFSSFSFKCLNVTFGTGDNLQLTYASDGMYSDLDIEPIGMGDI